MKNKSLISIHDYSKKNYLRIMDLAEEFEKNPGKYGRLLSGKVIATLFFEPSTRTRLSFESAVQRLGGKIIGFTDAGTSSVSKGETVKDTIKTVSQYSDLIVMRHPIEGSARWASEISDVPIVNAGDGANQHPTQCLLDLYTIRQTQEKLDNLTITMVGDLKYGRTVHSLIQAMSYFSPTFHFVSPQELKMPDEYKIFLKEKNIMFEEHKDLNEVMKKSDIVYVTRVQKERFSDPIEYEKVKNAFVLKNIMLEGSKKNLKILHPLPRVNEIDQDVDSNQKAYYFKQAHNGVFTRMAIISSILGLK
ncbi:MAG: aspartate carbamoyltransferase [Bacteroidetes bacterium CG02_land_8_20_14_3_00_31_25]|nr:aspartate carbamoyltransferase [Bacteroidota bacterium]PIV57861.1 MAG: aspartate carbamoyltransferase [Bacteroidetes bacterium CG02_land_8_20_14_3_00_31_25]PIX33180.1 MAG: aspartate carbamoyltransferase [Bacteroidetes bacterium CG_4_8_14_3_um_filter_31_14]